MYRVYVSPPPVLFLLCFIPQTACKFAENLKSQALIIVVFPYDLPCSQETGTRPLYVLRPPLPPAVNIEQYLENASKPLESQAFFVKAACMCADISGFTALSEKHCKKGTAGLDTLVQARVHTRQFRMRAIGMHASMSAEG